MGMHIEGVDRKIVCSEAKRLKNFRERQLFAITEDDHVLVIFSMQSSQTNKEAYISTFLHLRLDEPQQMFLVHAAGVVYVGIYLAKVVKVTDSRLENEMRFSNL